MKMRCRAIGGIAGFALFFVAGFAQAQDKYELNVQAYKGITFAQMFVDMSIGTFVDGLSANLSQYNPSLAADVGLVKGAVDRLASLRTFLDQCDADKNLGIGNWPLRLFFEEDLKIKVFDSPEVQTAVATLFQENFGPLEQYGLTLPWLLVGQRATQLDFIDLLYNTNFLGELGNLTPPDFFCITADDPSIDDEMAELAQQAVRIGLLGALPIYKANSNATVSADGLLDSVSPFSASNQCCTRSTRVCQTTSDGTSNCNMCGKSCCLGSTWCP